MGHAPGSASSSDRCPDSPYAGEVRPFLLDATIVGYAQPHYSGGGQTDRTTNRSRPLLKIPAVTVGKWRRSFAHCSGLEGLLRFAAFRAPSAAGIPIPGTRVQTRVCQQPEDRGRWT